MTNGLSSYGHVCSVIHWCVSREPPLLPDLLDPQALATEPRVVVSGLDMTFAAHVPEREEAQRRQVDLRETIRELAQRRSGAAAGASATEVATDGAVEVGMPWPPLAVAAQQYFQYMAATSEGELAAQTLSLRRQLDDDGQAGRRYSFPKERWEVADEQASQRLHARLSLEDPFELLDSTRPHDLGRTLSEPMARRLAAEWIRAADLLASQHGHGGDVLVQLMREHGKCNECSVTADGETDPSDDRFYCDACWRALHGPEWQPTPWG